RLPRGRARHRRPRGPDGPDPRHGRGRDRPPALPAHRGRRRQPRVGRRISARGRGRRPLTIDVRQPVEIAAAPPRPFPVWNVVLFVATIFTTLTAGAEFAVAGGWVAEPEDWQGWLRAGVPFSASLLAILVCHEMGHFVAARIHRV